jgi:hypothetical protein
MKKLLLLFALFPLTLQAQWITREIVVNPIVETTKLDSLVYYNGTRLVRNGQHRTAVTVIDSFHTDQGSAVVKYRGKNPTPAAAVASIAALQNIGGTSGIPGGAYLLSTAVGDTLWTMSDTATNTGSGAVVNSDTLSFWAPAKRFQSVRAGMQIQDSTGTGLPFMTLVDTVAADSNGFTIKQTTNAKNANARINFGYFTSTAYALGKTMGFPFNVSDSLLANKEYKLLQTVVAIDSSLQSDSIQLVLFNKPFREVCDNIAFGLADSDSYKIVGTVFLYPYINFSDNGVATITNVGLAVNRFPLYGQLFSRAGATTWLSSSALRLRFVFIRE